MHFDIKVLYVFSCAHAVLQKKQAVAASTSVCHSTRFIPSPSPKYEAGRIMIEKCVLSFQESVTSILSVSFPTINTQSKLLGELTIIWPELGLNNQLQCEEEASRYTVYKCTVLF